jgi:DNA-binding transcriptional MerR regulator
MVMEKSPDAFRTISEVAERLGVPAHVLRFWESRFPQVKPVKRAGGRRYYRRTDVALLDGIRKLLHDDGMSIRAVQALLREKGARTVAGFGRGLDFGEASGVGNATAEALDTAADLDRSESPATLEPVSADEADPTDLPAAGAIEPAADAAPDRGDAADTDGATPDTWDGADTDEATPALSDAPAADTAEPAPVPEAPMAQDVPVPDEPQVLRFVRAGAPRPSPAPAPASQSEFDLGPVGAAAPEPGPEPQPEPEPVAEPEPEPAPSLAVEVPADPDDHDTAYARPPRTGFGALDPHLARPLRERLATIRRRLGDPPHRSAG